MPLSRSIKETGSNLSDAQDQHHLHFDLQVAIPTPPPIPPRARTPNNIELDTFHFSIPTPAPTATRVRSTEGNPQTVRSILESFSAAASISDASTLGNTLHTFDSQYWLNAFTPPSSRSQSVEPSPERKSRSPGVTHELSNVRRSRSSTSTHRLVAPTLYSAQKSNRESLRSRSADIGSTTTNLTGCTDFNQPNDDNPHHSPSVEDAIPEAIDPEAAAPTGIILKIAIPDTKTPRDASSLAEDGITEESPQDELPSTPISHGIQLASRAAKPSVLEVFKRLFIELDLQVRIDKIPNHCIANTKKGLRCTRPMEKTNMLEVQRLITSLSTSSKVEIFTSDLLSIIGLVLCGQDHRKDIQRIAQDLWPSASKPSKTTSTTTLPPRKATAPTPPRHNYDFRPRSRNINSIIVPARFIPWQPEKHRSRFVSAAVAETMRRNLCSLDIDDGWLYEYWNESNFGFRKIGYTTKGIAIRLRQWESQCRHPAIEITETSQHGEIALEEGKVPNARRLEHLVHATLKNDRFCEQNCPTCGRRHEEWFLANDPGRIQRVKAFWTAWIRRKPYRFVKSVGEWRLRAKFEREVGEVCRKAEELVRETVQAKLVVRVHPRRNERGNAVRRSARLMEKNGSRRWY